MIEGHPHSWNDHIFHWIHRGGYPVPFGVLFMAGLGLPLPEDIPLLFAGVLIQRGEFDLAVASICAWLGIIGGDCVLYWLGRKFGAEVSAIPVIGSHVNTKRIKRVEEWFDRWGVWVVAIGRLFAGIRGAMVVVAGATKFNFVKFLVADGLAAIVSGGAFIWLGYKFGQNMHRLHGIDQNIKTGMLIALGVLLAGILVYLLWRKRVDRLAKARTLRDQPPMPMASSSESPPPVANQNIG